MLEILRQLESKRALIDVRNGNKNKLFQSDRRFHDWYRFVLSFPPQLVRQYIEDFGLGPNDLLLDPFCGTGTALVESKMQNVPSIGIEANNFAYFASSVKIDWRSDSVALLALAKQIRDAALGDLYKHQRPAPDLSSSIEPFLLKGLDTEKAKLILANSISPLPLHKSLVLLDNINRFQNSRFHKYLTLAMGNERSRISNKQSSLRAGSWCWEN